jgi:hypothetical protein
VVSRRHDKIRTWIAIGLVCATAIACRRHDEDGESHGAAHLRDELLRGTRLPEGLGALRAVVVISNPDASDVRIYARDLDADSPAPARELATFVTLVAGLRTGAVQTDARFECTGNACWRAHGSIGAREALAASCSAYFDDLAHRLDGSALAAAFLSLGIAAPPIPLDRSALAALASRGDGWALSARDALAIARAMYEHRPPWFAVVDEGLVPALGAPDTLRGKQAGVMSDGGWFVGYSTGAAPRLVVARVESCSDRCALAALRTALYALDRDRPTRTLPPPSRTPRAGP